MKKIITVFFILSIATYHTGAQGKTDSLGWYKGGYSSLSFSQAGFSNWVQGGENSLSLTALFGAFAKAKTKKTFWDNYIDLAYGLLNGESYKKIRKNDDKIELTSLYGRHAFAKFYYSGLLNFKTQFAPGYNYPNDSTVVSRFMAPGYLTVAAGLTWKPVSYFTLFVSPAAGRFVFVLDQELADIGSYGVDSAQYDANGIKIKDGQTVRPEFGANLNAIFEKEIVKNVSFKSNLTLFNNYTDKRVENRKNIDVDWQNGLNLKVNDFLAASVFTHMIYDDDILVPLYEDINGVKTEVGTGKRLQFKEIIGVGFSIKF
jgi:hypothetical protein